MDNGEFDNIIKDKLDTYSIEPSRELERKIFGFVFFQNLWVFHKMKIIASVLLICTVLGTSLYFDNNINKSTKDTFAVIENAPLLIDNNISKYNINRAIEKESISPKMHVNKYQEVQELLPDKQESDDDIVLNKEFDESNDDVVLSQELVESNESNASNILSTYDKSDNIDNKVHDVKLNSSAASSDYSYSNTANTNNEIPSISSNLPLIEKNKQINDVNEFDISNKQIINVPQKQIIKLFPLNIAALHTCPEEIDIENVPIISVSDYANNPVKRGFSIDAYFSPYSEVDVNNGLSDDYQQYWWDFYKEYDFEKSGLAGGINISYNYNNFKINSGFNFDQVFDYKPIYSHRTVDSIFVTNGSGVVSLYSVEQISGLEVYGNDTTLILYLDPEDDNLISEINNSANRFNYLRIPLTLGYELEFNNFSLEVNGGFEYSRMVQANGISYKDGYSDIGLRPCSLQCQGGQAHSHKTYHYTDMVATTYNNNKEVMVYNSLNYVANAILRVRITKSLDIFSSFKYQNNKQNIFNDDYILKKTYTRCGLNFGATYYLNPRLGLNELKTPKFD